ncbi:MAG TPA: N-acetyl-gamma-glutamyl-phosphate reductase, partial [Chitinophagales bacterium]
MAEKKIKVGIIGAAGYTGGELIRLLLLHPNAEIVFAQSTSNAGKPISSVHTDLLGETEQLFSAEHKEDIDVLFLCGGHGAAQKFLNDFDVNPNIAIIDLSHDFRLKEKNELKGRKFVYGLPELNREAIKESKNIANPGCFATAIQLALLPLAQANLLQNDVHVNAITGSTGAGQSLSETSHFSWRNNNISSYKVFTHQHLSEITESVKQLQTNFANDILFVPQRGNFTRGIFATAYTKFEGSESEAIAL